MSNEHAPPDQEHGPLGASYVSIDHIAFAVRDLEQAIALFRDILGFKLVERRAVRGRSTGMIAAEMEHNGIKFVLCQGTEDASQVSKLVSVYGPGVAHIALAVSDVRGTADELSRRGMRFDTDVIEGPGLTQTFTSRCDNTGLCFEFITRDLGKSGFEQGNVESLFNQLEERDRF